MPIVAAILKNWRFVVYAFFFSPFKFTSIQNLSLSPAPNGEPEPCTIPPGLMDMVRSALAVWALIDRAIHRAFTYEGKEFSVGQVMHALAEDVEPLFSSSEWRDNKWKTKNCMIRFWNIVTSDQFRLAF